MILGSVRYWLFLAAAALSGGAWLSGCWVDSSLTAGGGDGGSKGDAPNDQQSGDAAGDSGVDTGGGFTCHEAGAQCFGGGGGGSHGCCTGLQCNASQLCASTCAMSGPCSTPSDCCFGWGCNRNTCSCGMTDAGCMFPNSQTAGDCCQGFYCSGTSACAPCVPNGGACTDMVQCCDRGATCALADGAAICMGGN